MPAWEALQADILHADELDVALRRRHQAAGGGGLPGRSSCDVTDTATTPYSLTAICLLRYIGKA